jgi:inositol oxygenase
MARKPITSFPDKTYAAIAVNQLKASMSKPEWDDASQFDQSKDKADFRRYEEACERVKNFYKEQHG